MSNPIYNEFPSSSVDPVINFCTEVQMHIVRLSDITDLEVAEQLELLRVSTCLQKLCNHRMSNIFKELKNGKS